MKNLIAYVVVLPVEASGAMIAAALLLTIAVAVVITLALMPACAADISPPERSREKILRDPTRPLAPTTPLGVAVSSPPVQRPTAPVTLPQLQLVLTATERRFAVIDGELLGVGDSIRGLIVLDIRDEAVIVKTPQGPRTLPLSNGNDNQGN